MSRTSASTSSTRSRNGASGSAAPVQPVEDAHAVAAVEQALGQDAADVAGAAGDEDRLPGLGGLGGEAVLAAFTLLGLWFSVFGHRERRVCVMVIFGTTMIRAGELSRIDRPHPIPDLCNTDAIRPA